MNVFFDYFSLIEEILIVKLTVQINIHGLLILYYFN